MFSLSAVELNSLVLTVCRNIRYPHRASLQTLPKSMKFMVFDEKVRFVVCARVCKYKVERGVGECYIPFLAVTQEQR